MKNRKPKRAARQFLARPLPNQNTARAALVLGGLLACSGCTHTARQRARAQSHLAEESRALTSAVVDALQMQPADQRDPFSATALLFAKQDQHLEGLPLAPFDVPALLSATNAAAFAVDPMNTPPAIPAQATVQKRFAAQNKSLASEHAATDRLVERGIVAEQAANRRTARWFKLGTLAATLLGGAAALAVFCPVALPIAGRLLAWCVGKFPALASKLGVVGTNAFDAVVRGIEHFKRTGTPADPATEDLHASLSRELDAAHKELVRTRKAALNLA